MRSKLSKIMGVGLALVLVASMMAFALPVAASPDENEWSTFDYPDSGADGDWFYDPGIGSVGPMAQAINGDLYAYVAYDIGEANEDHMLMKSEDGGRAWTESTSPNRYGAGLTLGAGPVVDMVCSELSEDVIYLTDGNYVYKSISGGTTFAPVAAESLEKVLMGACGIPVTDQPITCLDVGYDASNKPYVFIGVTFALVGPTAGTSIGADISEDLPIATGTAGKSVGADISTTLSITISEATTAATLTIGGGVSAVTYDAVAPGAAGNDITVAHVDPGATGSLEVSVSENDITVTLAHDETNVTSTATEVAAAVNVAAAAFVNATAADPGEGIAAVKEATNLADGADKNDQIKLTVDTGGTETQYTIAADTYATGAALVAAINAAEDVAEIRLDASGATVSWDTGYIVFTSDSLGSTSSVAVTDGTNDASVILGFTDPSETIGADQNQIQLQVDDVESITPYDIAVAIYGTGEALVAAINAAKDAEGIRLDASGATASWVYDDHIVFTSDSVGITSSVVVVPAGDPDASAILGFDENSTKTSGSDHGISPDILYIDELAIGATWENLGLSCYDPPSVYTPYAVGCTPDFATAPVKLMVVVTTPADVDTGLTETHVISSNLGVCGWGEVAELKYNDETETATPFEISHASRIAFSDDYADTNTLFVGVVDASPDGDGGDVYMVTASSALDLNVDIVDEVANIISLDTDGASLIAGAYGATTDVYYSTDGGWTWDVSAKNPSGGDAVTDKTYALWYEDSALAATTGDECAVSMSCGEEVGEFWNQISLIATDIDAVLDISHAPGYLTGTSPIFIATECEKPLSYSLFRYDQTYWERVYVNTLADYKPINWVQVSPDFDDTEAVFVASIGFDIFRSVDAGCSWTKLRYSPTATIGAWVVIDEDTVLAGGSDGDAETIFKTTRHGARPWDEYTVTGAGDGVSFALSPDIAADDSVLYGDAKGQVFISEDLGEEWDEVVDASTGIFTVNDTYVIFDPGYGTSGDEGELMIYAAAGDTVGRCDIDPDASMSKQDWVEICDDLVAASGIAAAGDTALYVADVGSVEGGEEIIVDVDGTIAVSYTGGAGTCDFSISDAVVTKISGAFLDKELVSIIEYTLNCDETGSIEGVIGIKGYDSGAIGSIAVSEACAVCTGAAEVTSSFLTVAVTGAYAPELDSGVLRTLNPMAPVAPLVEFERLTSVPSPSSLAHLQGSDDLWLTAGSNVLWALDFNTSTIWIWDDPLARPVIQMSPDDGDPLATTTTATLEWKALDGATEYEVVVYVECPECLSPSKMKDFTTKTTSDTCITITDLTPGTTYYWQVRVAEGEPFLSKWSDLREFDTALSSVPGLCSPICGASDIILTPNFSWDPVAGATGYEVEIATNEGFSPVIASGTPTVNAWAAAPELDYSTTYYWHVRAVKGDVVGAWSVCLFTTMDEPVEPVTPVDVITEEIVPIWIWVIIGIGAALVIAVIVLIVNTRRVP